MPEKKSGLSKEAFDNLLAWLNADRERAGEKYATLHQKLVTVFLSRGFSPAEKHADEVFNRIARRLADPDGNRTIQTDDPEKFALGVARKMIAFEGDRRPEAKETSFEGWMQDGGERPSGDPEEEYVVAQEGKQKKRCFKGCWAGLTEDERALLTAYYEFEGQTDHPLHRELAKQLGITEGSLRSRISRTKKKLSDCVQDCMGTKK